MQFAHVFRTKSFQNANQFARNVTDFMASLPDGIVMAGASSDDFFFISEPIVRDDFEAYGK